MAELSTLALLVLTLGAGGVAAHRLRLPPAFGYLAAGILVGAFLPDLVPHEVEVVGELGILVLLFLIGIELDLKRLRASLAASAWSMPFDIAVPGLLAAGAARLIGWPLSQAIALGIVVAVSSTLFGERLAAQQGFDGRARQRVLGVLISEDVAAAGLIALLVVLASGAGGFGAPALAIGETALLLLILTAVALLAVPRILDEVARRHVPELLVLWAIAAIAVFATLGSFAGSAELGALVAGVAAAEAGSRYVTRNALAGIRDLAGAVFFFASGTLVDPALVLAGAGMAAIVAGAVFVGKQAVHVPAALAGGLPLRSALQSAGALTTLGEFNLILVAVAEREALAHPQLRAVVVGAMVVLLPLATLLTRSAPRLEKAVWRGPRPLREGAEVLVQAMRRRPAKARRGAWKEPLRRFIVNAALVVALALLVVWVQPRFPEIPRAPPWGTTAVWFGLSLALAAPLLRATYRAHRALVWALVGLRPGERVGAGKVRARLVDAWVAMTGVLVLAFISLWIPRALPVLLGGVVLALLIAAVAWRGLNRFHRTLENALGRVLGQDEAGTRFLDQVLDQYPWGVRFAAVTVPHGSPLAGRTLHESRLRVLTGATVAVVQRGRKETVNPPPDHRLHAGDHLVLLGEADQLAKAEALLVAHGEAIRLSAQSATAQVEEIDVDAESPWAGQPLSALAIRETTGTLIIGHWPADATAPLPFQADATLAAGDRLILLGTPLQLQRARIMAGAIPVAEG